jgi:DNA-binding NarL/FixJ family response regulator
MKGAANVKASSDQSVLVLAIDATPAPDLLRIVLRHAWPVRQPASASAAFAEILRYHPSVVLIQISSMAGEAVELIRLVRSGSLPLLLVGVSFEHGDEIERAARIAGVDCYLDGSGDASLIECVVAEHLTRQECVARRADAQRSPSPRRYQRSLSLLLPNNMGDGRNTPVAHPGRPGECHWLRAAGSAERHS